MFIFFIVVSVILCTVLVIGFVENDPTMVGVVIALIIVFIIIAHCTLVVSSTPVTEAHNAETKTPAIPKQSVIPVDLLDDLTIAATKCNSAKVILITSIDSGSLDANKAKEIINECKLSKLREELNK